MKRGPDLAHCDLIREGLVLRRPSLSLTEIGAILSKDEHQQLLDTLADFIDIEDPSVRVASRLTPARFFDADGEVAIDGWFKDGRNFQEGLARVQPPGDKGWGFIDRQGNVVIPFDYDEASDFVAGAARVTKGGKTRFIDPTGKTILATDRQVEGPLRDNRVRVSRMTASGERRFGFIDRQDQLVIPYQFEEAGDYSEGITAVAAGKQHGKPVWRFIGLDGRPAPGLGNKTFDTLFGVPTLRHGLALVHELSLSDEGTHVEQVGKEWREVPGSVVKKWGYVNRKGEWIYGPIDVDWNPLFNIRFKGQVCDVMD